MQAQTTGSRRFSFHWITVLALAISALVIAAAVAVLSDAVDLPFTDDGDNRAVAESRTQSTAKTAWDYGDIETDRPQAAQPDYALPADRPATFDRSGTTRANRGDHRRTGSELNGVLVGPIQSYEQTYFLEQNIWEYAVVPAVDQRPDDYPSLPGRLDYEFSQEDLLGVEPADTSAEATAVHPDTYPGDGLD